MLVYMQLVLNKCDWMGGWLDGRRPSKAVGSYSVKVQEINKNLNSQRENRNIFVSREEARMFCVHLIFFFFPTVCLIPHFLPGGD